MTVTGIPSSSPRRSQSGSIAPAPSPRSTAASAAGSLRRMSARQCAAAAGGVPANSGWCIQRSANSSIVPRSVSSASFSSAARRSSRSAGSSMPAVLATSTSRLTRSGWASGAGPGRADPLGVGERAVQRDPPAERVAAQHEALGRLRRDVGHALREPDRARVAGVAVAAEVERERAIAFGVEAVGDEVPRVAGTGEPVQEDDSLRHWTRPIFPETTDTYLLLRAFVDELVRCRIAGACTSPGSRSPPLVLSLVRDGPLPCWSHVDERVAGFFALGAAKATGRPVAVTCTSGTASAHYLPAVVDASEARVPLTVLPAGRPPELREVGAGQAIDQLKLYGDHVRWFFDVGTHDATPERVRWMRALACRAAASTLGGRPRPVHLHVAF